MPRRIDITGQRFGTWQVTGYAGGSRWDCRCDCGAAQTANGKALRKGQLRWCDGCGEKRPTSHRIDLTGQRFGRLTVTGVAPRLKPNDDTRWHCQCDCGEPRIVRSKALRRGMTLSCRCYTKEVTAKRNATRDFLVVRNAREYAVWFGMRARCHNPDHIGYADYGGRGIAVCERWRESFEAFLEDMGKRPAGMSIDRIDNDGPYAPDNCRWATQKEQMRNTSRNHYVEANGERLIVTDWAAKTGISVALIHDRIKRGWSEADAVSRPPRRITRTPLYEATRCRHRFGAKAA